MLLRIFPATARPGTAVVPKLLFMQAYDSFPNPYRSSTMAPKKPMKDLKKGVSSKKASNIKGGRKALPKAK